MWQDDWKVLFYMETVSVQHTPSALLKWNKVLCLILRPNLILFQNVICILIPILCWIFSAVQNNNKKKYAPVMHPSQFTWDFVSYKKGKEG